jgi:hypothetical protein
MAPIIDWIGSLVGIETDLNGTASKALPLRGIGRQSLSHLTGFYLLQSKALKLDTNKLRS